MAAATAATAAKALSRRLAASLRSTGYQTCQIRPGYGQAGPVKEIDIKDVFQAVRRLEHALQPPNVSNADYEKRIAKLEALVSFGKVVMGVILTASLFQGPMIHQLQKDQGIAEGRLGALEQASKVAVPTPPPTAPSLPPPSTAPSLPPPPSATSLQQPSASPAAA